MRMKVAEVEGLLGVVGKGRGRERSERRTTRRSYTPPKRRPARARALPDAGGRGFRMRACRLVVYFIFNKSLNILRLIIININKVLLNL
jgi:hypothetical protein